MEKTIDGQAVSTIEATDAGHMAGRQVGDSLARARMVGVPEGARQLVLPSPNMS
ncbi:hypothetical protein AB4079_11795 [Leifsonia sp. 2MCAF36]